MTLKIIEQTPRRLTIQARISQTSKIFQLIWSGSWIAIFILYVVLAARYTGKVSLTCNRTKPDRVSCTQDWIPVLGKSQTIPLDHIRSARIEKNLGQDSPRKKSQRYRIILDTERDMIPLGIPADSLGTEIKKLPFGWLIDKPIQYIQNFNSIRSLRTQEGRVDRINQFLNDSQENLLVIEIEFSRIPLDMLFLAMGVNIITYFWQIWNCFSVRKLCFDKSISSLTITNKNLRSQQVFQHAIDEIIGLRVEQVRANNQIFYKTVILLSGQQYLIDYYKKQQAAEQSLEPLHAFLNLPLQILEVQNTLFGQNVKPPQSEVIFTGKKGVYYNSNICALQKVSSDEVEKIDSQFAAIGFELLGDLLWSKYSNSVLRGYVKPGAYIYGAVIQRTSSNRWELEFTTIFASGATLTTTTLPGIWDCKQSKFFCNSYPSLGLGDLLLSHQKRVQQLSQEQGPAIKVGNNLEALAVAIDESPEPGAIEQFLFLCRRYWILIGPGARLAIAGVALLLFLFVGRDVYKGIQINRSSEHPIEQQE